MSLIQSAAANGVVFTAQIRTAFGNLFSKCHGSLSARNIAHDIQYTDAHGIEAPTLFPWKTFYDFLAEHHLWIENWPTKCLLPAQHHPPNLSLSKPPKPKGIADLWIPEVTKLAIALRITGNTKYPLVMHKATKAEQQRKFKDVLYDTLADRQLY